MADRNPRPRVSLALQGGGVAVMYLTVFAAFRLYGLLPPLWAFGLMIAIPALLFYRFFRGRVDEYTVDMEQAAERLVPHLMRFAVRRGSSAGASGAATS